MENRTLFFELNKKIKTQKEKICMKDVAKIYCSNKDILDRVKSMEVYRMEAGKEKRCVLGILRLVAMIQEAYPELQIQSIGENRIIIEQVFPKKTGGFLTAVKAGAVAAVCFFGTIFTIMAYHNDINILPMFERIKTITGEDPKDRMTMLEISYSMGLSLGIILFYNHVGKRKLTEDPTPIAVEMRTYEDQVSQSLVELAEREGKVIDLA